MATQPISDLYQRALRLHDEKQNSQARESLSDVAFRILQTNVYDGVDLPQLAGRLEFHNRLYLARRIYQLFADSLRHPLSVAEARKLALYTYKDPDTAVDQRISASLDILRKYADLDHTTDPETLANAGGILKFRWRVYNQRYDLETAWDYYDRAYRQGLGDGYPAINAAYLLDLLAGDRTDPAAEEKRRQASAIRQEIVDKLSDEAAQNPNYWIEVTLAEAHFGLGQFEEARPFLQAAGKRESEPEWRLEATTRQFASLARLLEQRNPSPENGNPWSVLAVLLVPRMGGDLKRAEAVVAALRNGKVGIALSGGGFRASLFHLGVLARFGELGILPGVEVISCVSGGSIVGAHYYLKLRKLLNEVPEADLVPPARFEQLVRELIDEFLDGVQSNIRVRSMADLRASLKLAFLPNYSRSERLAELYEKYFYWPLSDPKDNPRILTDLFVQPCGWNGGSDFNPVLYNWRREVKVPNLVLNTTSLNTGHSWQFTASFMGEPPARAGDSEIESNCRLRRLYHTQAPSSFQPVKIGQAVAASACVPGMFEPLLIRGLFENYSVRLVDGGVHDNQGLDSLLDQDCTALLISDASGQLGTEKKPSGDLFRVMMRATNSILMARVRETQYQDLLRRRQSGQIQGLVFLHLRKDLEEAPVDWIGCQDPTPKTKRDPVTPYGIPVKVQWALSGVRTDLDSFSDTEALALMYSGYCMATEEVAKHPEDFPLVATVPQRWRFFDIADSLDAPDVLKRLKVAKNQAFKPWRLRPALCSLLLLPVVALAVLLVFGLRHWLPLQLAEPYAAPAALIVAAALLVSALLRKFKYGGTMDQTLVGVLLCLLWPVFLLHLYLYDPVFRRDGRID